MKTPETYKDLYDELEINIFARLWRGAVEEVLKDMFSSNIAANIEFIANYGNRKLSSLFKYIYENFKEYDKDTDEFKGIKDTGLDYIAETIENSFKYKWNKLFSTLYLEYDALKPFNIELQETATDTLDTQKDKTTYVDNDGSYGFNSTTSTPTDKADGESNREYKRTIDNTRDYTRVGNIGNTSFQELIMQEREVAKINLKSIILEDISTILCRGKYI